MENNMKLQQLTGLTDKDPLHCYLKMVDEFMGNNDNCSFDIGSSFIKGFKNDFIAYFVAGFDCDYLCCKFGHWDA